MLGDRGRANGASVGLATLEEGACRVTQPYTDLTCSSNISTIAIEQHGQLLRHPSTSSGSRGASIVVEVISTSARQPTAAMGGEVVRKRNFI